MKKLKKLKIWKFFWKEEKEASYTVEAAFIMAIILFLIASLLSESFKIHSQIVGDMVLQDTMEKWGFREEEKEESEIILGAEQRLKSYFWCGGKQLKITQNGRRISGTVNDTVNEAQSSNISIRVFEPEKFLRLMRAVGL